MYDLETRRRLAEELVEAFCEGGFDAAELAERGAGRLERWPSWLNALSSVIEARGARMTGRRAAAELDRAGRRALIVEVERFLSRRPAAAGDETGPWTPGEQAGWDAGGWSGAGWGAGGAGRGRGRTRMRHDWPIPTIDSAPELAERLELSVGQLEWLADVRGLERSARRERLRNYRYRWIPRRSGPPRLIEAPKLRLKEVQRFVLREILDYVPAHAAACGFVPGRSVIDHAAHHRGRAAVLRLDLRDFFASVPAARVFATFTTLGYADPVAHALTGLTTNTTAWIARDALRGAAAGMHADARFHLERRLAVPHLPQGAPTSPALANLAAFAMDRRLSALAAAMDLRYSRYADDLTFSGERLRRGAQAREVTLLVARIARSEGFALHSGKSLLRTAARRQTLTGIVVNAHPNVARDDYDRLRATLHRAVRDGPGAVVVASRRGAPVEHDLRAHLNGRVAWVESVNPHRGAKLRRQFDAIVWERA